MPPGAGPQGSQEFLLFTALFGVVGLGLVAYGGRRLLEGLDIRRGEVTAVDELPTTATRVAVEGTVTVVGATLEGPWAGDVVLYEYEATHRDAAGNDETVLETSESTPFLVDDGTGTVRVDPAGATTSVSTTGWSYDAERLPDPHREFITDRLVAQSAIQRGETPAALDAAEDGEIEVTYGTVAVDDEVWVRGTLTPGDDGPAIGGDETWVSDTGGEEMMQQCLRVGSVGVAFGLVFLGVAGWAAAVAAGIV